MKITTEAVRRVLNEHPEAEVALRKLLPEAFPTRAGGALTITEADGSVITVAVPRSEGPTWLLDNLREWTLDRDAAGLPWLKASEREIP